MTGKCGDPGKAGGSQNMGRPHDHVLRMCYPSSILNTSFCPPTCPVPTSPIPTPQRGKSYPLTWTPRRSRWACLSRKTRRTLGRKGRTLKQKGVAVTRGLHVVYRGQSLSNVTFPQGCVCVSSHMHTQATAQMWRSGDNLVGAGSFFPWMTFMSPGMYRYVQYTASLAELSPNAWLFMWVLMIKLGSSCSKVQQACYQLSHSPYLQWPFKITYFNVPI